jgi:hypothetical protein
LLQFNPLFSLISGAGRKKRETTLRSVALKAFSFSARMQGVLTVLVFLMIFFCGFPLTAFLCAFFAPLFLASLAVGGA